MQEMSIELEQGDQSPLDFLVDLREFMRAKVKKGELKAYSIALPIRMYDILDATAMHDEFAVKFTCPDCGSSSYIEDPDTPSKLTCKQCGKIYGKPV